MALHRSDSDPIGPPHTTDAGSGGTSSARSSADHIALTERWAAHNYHPLPVVMPSGEGAWVTDVEGQRYLDCLAGYSALNFGHGHPRLLARAATQLPVTLTSRAFYNDQLGPFAEALSSADRQRPRAPDEHRRRGGRDRASRSAALGLPGQGRAGRTRRRSSSAAGTSTAAPRRSSASPTTRPSATLRTLHARLPTVPFGDAAAIGPRSRRTPSRCCSSRSRARRGWSSRRRASCATVREICSRAACSWSPTRSSRASAAPAGPSPATTRASCPTSTCSARRWAAGSTRLGGRRPTRDVLGVITPGRPRLDVRRQPAGRRGRPRGGADAHDRGAPVRRPAWVSAGEGLAPLVGRRLAAVRIRGLWAGRRHRARGTDRPGAVRGLLARGVLAKDTHGQTIRLAPPLVATEEDIDVLIAALHSVLDG